MHSYNKAAPKMLVKLTPIHIWEYLLIFRSLRFRRKWSFFRHLGERVEVVWRPSHVLQLRRKWKRRCRRQSLRPHPDNLGQVCTTTINHFNRALRNILFD